jgi:hypothetical protein
VKRGNWDAFQSEASGEVTTFTMEKIATSSTRRFAWLLALSDRSLWLEKQKASHLDQICGNPQ